MVQKEEEVTILKKIVKELESTINVLEKKVNLNQHFLKSHSMLKQKSCLHFLFWDRWGSQFYELNIITFPFD